MLAVITNSCNYTGVRPVGHPSNDLIIKFLSGLVPLTIEVRKVDLSGENEQLAWHIADTRSAWAICGRTSGVLEFDRGQDVQSISVDLMPLFIGRLRLPQVDLKRLSSATSATASEHDSSLSSLDSPHYKGADFLVLIPQLL